MKKEERGEKREVERREKKLKTEEGRRKREDRIEKTK